MASAVRGFLYLGGATVEMEELKFLGRSYPIVQSNSSPIPRGSGVTGPVGVSRVVLCEGVRTRSKVALLDGNS